MENRCQRHFCRYSHHRSESYFEISLGVVSPRPYQYSRFVANNSAIRWHIINNNCSCSYFHMVSNMYTTNNNSTSTHIYIIAQCGCTTMPSTNGHIMKYHTMIPQLCSTIEHGTNTMHEYKSSPYTFCMRQLTIYPPDTKCPINPSLILN